MIYGVVKYQKEGGTGRDEGGTTRLVKLEGGGEGEVGGVITVAFVKNGKQCRKNDARACVYVCVCVCVCVCLLDMASE
jgi:hypothetical protein